MREKNSGFTLIELMVVVAIIAIIATIGYPSYLGHVQKTHRANIQGEMVSTAQALERCYTTKGAYNDAACIGDSVFDRYNLTIAKTAETFTITATPTGAQASDSCGTMTYNQTNTKTPASCW
ncbi:type IV pilin protein [Sedimenticola sp.]|uniref:type IV pilin protein n=1 Tax=Sedimenticola sp. TaxID=1940285 RepID=UPI003D107888